MKIGDRVRVKPECFGFHDRTNNDGGNGSIIKIGDGSLPYHVKLDHHNNTWWYKEDELILLEDKMEYTLKSKTYRQLKDITVKALIKQDAPDEDIDIILEDYDYTEPISLRYAIDYASSCNEKLQWLVDQGFVEVVEEAFKVKVGDRFMVGGCSVILAQVDAGLISLIALDDGNRWAHPVKAEFISHIVLCEFRDTLGDYIDRWEEVYATRNRK